MAYTLSELLNDEGDFDQSQLQSQMDMVQRNPYYYRDEEKAALAQRMDRMKMPMSMNEMQQFQRGEDQMQGFQSFAARNPYYYRDDEMDALEQRKKLMKSYPRLSSLFANLGYPTSMGGGQFGSFGGSGMFRRF